ncbi:MAG: zinc-ribbon domain-containing protein [Desulfobacteraceae bacterium]
MLECPFCGEALPSKQCPECGEDVPENAKFCTACGAGLEAEELPDAHDSDDLDLENRILCPDGTCTGIIENGRCTECGRPYPGDDTQESGG